MSTVPAAVVGVGDVSVAHLDAFGAREGSALAAIAAVCDQSFPHRPQTTQGGSR